MIKTPAALNQPFTVEKKLSTLVRPVPPAANRKFGKKNKNRKAENCLKYEIEVELDFRKRFLFSLSLSLSRGLERKCCLSFYVSF
jgi:hypothetical protein